MKTVHGSTCIGDIIDPLLVDLGVREVRMKWCRINLLGLRNHHMAVHEYTWDPLMYT
jgi:hypothetical protein